MKPSFLLLSLALALPTFANEPPVVVVTPENDIALGAARQGNVLLWREMLKLGASPQARDASGNNALVMAVLGEHEDMLREVLLRGVDVNARGDVGMTALSIAVTRGHQDVVRRLLNAGARPDVADATGTTPLAIATRTGRNDLVSLLLQAGADPDRADESRVTPLHLAAERGNLVALAALLSADANPNVLDREHRSPLFAALFEQQTQAAELLIRHRHTDLRLPTQGDTPRGWAGKMGQTELVALIDKRLLR